MVAKIITKKKNPEIVKQELLKFNIQNIIDQRQAIDIIKHYEEIIKTIRYEVIQGQMLEKLKNMEVLSRSTTHFLNWSLQMFKKVTGSKELKCIIALF